MRTIEDTASFFIASDFAVDALWKGTDTVQAIPDDAYTETLGTNGSNPFVQVQTSQVAGIKRNDTFRMNAVDYTVKNVEPDGTGITRLELQKV